MWILQKKLPVWLIFNFYICNRSIFNPYLGTTQGFHGDENDLIERETSEKNKMLIDRKDADENDDNGVGDTDAAD